MNKRRSMTPYQPVRVVSRTIMLLEELSRLGRANPGALAIATGIDRATVYRLLATLKAHNLVSNAQDPEFYTLALGVRLIAEGYREDDRTNRVIASAMGKLLAEARWPSDFASFHQGGMVVRESTHRFSAFSVHRTMLGHARPLTTSSLGLAALAWANDADRDMMLSIAASKAADGQPADIHNAISRQLAWVRAQGFASAHTNDAPVPLAAIALPVRVKAFPLAALNIVFFSKALTVAEAIRRFLPALKVAVSAIENEK